MKIDVYGSRYTLINLIKLSSKFDLEISNAYTGTTIESQLKKEVPINEEKLKEIISKHEILEIKTDFNKRLRKFHKFTNSKVIVIDFMIEGSQTIQFNNKFVTKRPVLLRYGYNTLKGKEVNYSEKINNSERYIETLLEYLSDYDLVILNKVRQAKLIKNANDELTLRKNILDINFQNFYAELMEDLLLQKREDICIIPEFSDKSLLIHNYMSNKNYIDFFSKNIKEILDKEMY